MLHFIEQLPTTEAEIRLEAAKAGMTTVTNNCVLSVAMNDPIKPRKPYKVNFLIDLDKQP